VGDFDCATGEIIKIIVADGRDFELIVAIAACMRILKLLLLLGMILK